MASSEIILTLLLQFLYQFYQTFTKLSILIKLSLLETVWKSFGNELRYSIA